jgi:nucleotide-binding universal stress UspA family protein
MQTILCLTDFSPAAGNALRFAYPLANHLGARIVLLHVYQKPLIDLDRRAHPTLRALADKNHEAARGHFHDYAMESQADLSNRIPIELRIEEGFAVEEILRMCQALTPDLVVMGTKGASNLIEDLFGSTTNQVIQQVKAPVLLVPPEATYRSISRIALATDSHMLNFREGYPVLHLAQVLGAELLRVHLVPTDTNDATLKALNSWHKVEWPWKQPLLHVIRADQTLDALDRFTHEYTVDLVAVVSRPHAFWKQCWHPSFTQRMLLHAHTPVLAWPSTLRHANDRRMLFRVEIADESRPAEKVKNHGYRMEPSMWAGTHAIKIASQVRVHV